MLKWLGKIRMWRRGLEGPVVYDYGRYVYKPVMCRAVAEVIGVAQSEVCSWIQDPEIDVYLNNELIQDPQERLESGNYEIKIPSQDKVWRFFIA